MISNATKRSILRWIHLIFSIPILGYIYSPFEEIVLSGFWMYSGVTFAIIGVAVWVGAYYVSGLKAAVLSQVVVFIARKAWLVIRARNAKRPDLSLAAIEK